MSDPNRLTLKITGQRQAQLAEGPVDWNVRRGGWMEAAFD